MCDNVIIDMSMAVKNVHDRRCSYPVDIVIKSGIAIVGR